MAEFAPVLGNLIGRGVKSPLYPHLAPGGGRWGIQLIGALRSRVHSYTKAYRSDPALSGVLGERKV